MFSYIRKQDVDSLVCGAHVNDTHFAAASAENHRAEFIVLVVGTLRSIRTLVFIAASKAFTPDFPRPPYTNNRKGILPTFFAVSLMSFFFPWGSE